MKENLSYKVRVADFLSSFIYDEIGVQHVFMLSGAGSMHLTDGLASHGKITPICVHHEQSASMALEAYSRANENFGVGYFSTGPAATNAITGLAGAWQDSVPCLFISGQVKRNESSNYMGLKGLRQFGVQELNIIPIVKSICKYAAQVKKPEDIKYELQKAVYFAKKGRPGPSWLDIPMDIQGAEIDLKDLNTFEKRYTRPNLKKEKIDEIVSILKESNRPVIIAGRGVRLAGANNLLENFCSKYQIPIVTPYLGIDNINHDKEFYIGKTGVKGDRAANFAMQSSDLILSIGSSLHVSVTGYEYKNFAKNAKKIVIDIDKKAHLKKTIDIDKFYKCDAYNFLKLLQLNFHEKEKFKYISWRKKCTFWKKKYPVCLPEYDHQENSINIYKFIDRLSELSNEDDIFIADAGSAIYAISQGIKLSKRGQRYLPSSAMATMGYSLPAAIGAGLVTKNRVFSITGDGSLQQNIQELQTLKHYDLPIKLFILNNNGYLSIRASQKNYFSSRYIGEGVNSGVSFPDTLKICKAYGIQSSRVQNLSKLDSEIEKAINSKGPYVLDIITPENQPIIPTVSSIMKNDGTMESRPLDDMAPFLNRNEYLKNILK